MKTVKVNEITKIVHHAERESVIGANATNQVLLTKEELEHTGAKKFTFMEYIVFPPGTSTPRHTDPPGTETIVFVTRGEAIFSIDDKESVIKGGTIIYIKPGQPHYLKTNSNHNLEYVYFTIKLGK